MRRIYERAAKPRGVRDIIPQIAAYGIGSGINLGSPASAFFGEPSSSLTTEPRVLGLPAAWRCVNFLANGVASMAPMRMLTPDGFPADSTPTVVERPNAIVSTYEFWHTAVCAAVMHGNFIGLLEDFDPYTNYPRQVIPVPLTAISRCQYVQGRLIYTIAGDDYGPLDVVHVRGYTMPGSPWGLGVVEVFRRAMAQALEQQSLAGDVYKRGSVPSGVLEIPVPRPEKQQVEDAQEQWIEHHGGQRKPAVLPQGWKFTPLQWSPEDAEFLASRLFSVAELSLMFGLDPSDVGASFPSGGTPSMTYANVSQRQVGRIVDSYMPWSVRFEQAWSDLVPGGNRCEFDPKRLLRADPLSQAEIDAKDISSGVVEVDEARAVRGLPPLPAQPERVFKDIPAVPSPADVAPDGSDDASTLTGVIPVPVAPAATTAPVPGGTK